MKKVIPFDIKYRPQVESGEMKVQTMDGRNVRIVYWDSTEEKFPIMGYISGEFRPDSWMCDGSNFIGRESCNDLVLVTEEPELTKFEDALLDFVVHKDWCEDTTYRDNVKMLAPKLLELAKKELCAKGELITQEHHQNLMDMMCEKTKDDTLNSLPIGFYLNDGKNFKFFTKKVKIKGDEGTITLRVRELSEED